MEKTIDYAQAFVIQNTLKNNNNRPNNIIEIAENISFLSEKLGGLNQVSKIIGISSEMLSHFLKVKKLNIEVKKLVEKRKIDSVTVVKYLSKFNEDEQIYIAKEIINGNLNSVELRFIYPLRNKLKELPIQEVVNKHLQSKNIKISKAIFEITDNQISVDYLNNVFSKIVGEENFISINIQNNIGILKVSRNGEKILRDSAKKENLTLKHFFSKILNDIVCKA